MIIRWYIIPFVVRPFKDLFGGTCARACALRDHSEQIESVGGKWASTEINGNRCLVKVKTTQEQHELLDGKYKQLPNLGFSAELNVTQRAALKEELLDQGYTIEEIKEHFSDSKPTVRDFYNACRKHKGTPAWTDETKTDIHMTDTLRECDPEGLSHIENQVK